MPAPLSNSTNAQSTLLYSYNYYFSTIFLDIVMADMMMIPLAICIVYIYMTINLKSLFLSTCGMGHIFASFFYTNLIFHYLWPNPDGIGYDYFALGKQDWYSCQEDSPGAQTCPTLASFINDMSAAVTSATRDKPWNGSEDRRLFLYVTILVLPTSSTICVPSSASSRTCCARCRPMGSSSSTATTPAWRACWRHASHW